MLLIFCKIHIFFYFAAYEIFETTPPVVETEGLPKIEQKNVGR